MRQEKLTHLIYLRSELPPSLDCQHVPQRRGPATLLHGLGLFHDCRELPLKYVVDVLLRLRPESPPARARHHLPHPPTSPPHLCHQDCRIQLRSTRG